MENAKLVLEGSAANKGIVKGRVKIVHGPECIDKFEEGDVLVAEFTCPSMVIMMNKACAFVTDTGGLTCHAAIIARELGIPCIVATKQATKILKDGQKVLVDGEKGKVYLLED